MLQETRQDYQRVSLPNEIQYSTTSIQMNWERHVIGEQEPEQVEDTINVRFDLEELDFNTITEMLLDLEQESNQSTIDLFRRYISDNFEHDENIERWFDLFFLYLGTREVRQYSCP